MFAEAADVEVDPEPAWRRTLMWAGVRAFGWWAWWKHRREERMG